ncbi:2-nitropropane dioxygenase [Microbacterium bovistercoris]|uniref:2-nitropropane dioxygenase n=1 Tax=Microbacterium bovistercoris TaxID=2293570 RepID=A0A371NXM9_9MICO|nr:nucleotidyltransferase family protein [Microbacterium bovistercoris]REJ08060.1 2-nitropropane dioxygenase [Microbacterium bovistercoris]
MNAPEVPVWALSHLTHAALQRTAERASVDILHIKGPATRGSLRAGRHDSSDADVLVRPAHLERFLTAMQDDGWTLYTGFEEGSPFGHAANFTHPSWTYADVHRLIPGPLLPADETFERLWRDREATEIAHRGCSALSVPAQVLVQSLHAARSHGDEAPEAWMRCPDELRPQVRALAVELRAETAFAAGIGELDRHGDAADHALWSYWSSTDLDRLDEWAARYRSARSFGERWQVIRQAARVNRTHLRIRLGREPRPLDIAREQVARVAKGAGSLTRHLLGRTPR